MFFVFFHNCQAEELFIHMIPLQSMSSRHMAALKFPKVKKCIFSVYLNVVIFTVTVGESMQLNMALFTKLIRDSSETESKQMVTEFNSKVIFLLSQNLTTLICFIPSIFIFFPSLTDAQCQVVTAWVTSVGSTPLTAVRTDARWRPGGRRRVCWTGLRSHGRHLKQKGQPVPHQDVTDRDTPTAASSPTAGT